LSKDQGPSARSRERSRSPRVSYHVTAVLVVGVAALVVAAITQAGGGTSPQFAPMPVASPDATSASPAPSRSATATAPASPVLLRDDFSRAGLERAPTGQRYRTVDLPQNKFGMTVKNGRLVHGDPVGGGGSGGGGAGAGYLESKLPDDVRVIGAEAAFPSRSGSVALVVWDGSLAASLDPASPAGHPKAGIHFVADSRGWTFGIYKGTGQDIIGRRTYEVPLAADGETKHRFEVSRRGDRVWVTDPDGKVTGPIQDKRILEWAGEWPCWELYEHSKEMSPAAMATIWAG
jgi:hypothetical protein